jgi:hypothetical protein
VQATESRAPFCARAFVQSGAWLFGVAETERPEGFNVKSGPVVADYVNTPRARSTNP